MVKAIIKTKGAGAVGGDGYDSRKQILRQLWCGT